MPAGHSTGRRSALGPRAKRRAERRRRLRRTVLGSAAVVAVSATAYAIVPLDDAASVSDSVPAPAAVAPDQDPAAAPSPSASSGSPSPGHSAASPNPGAASSKPGGGGSSAAAPVPQSGPGVFAASSRSGQPQGKGTARRWRIEVEEGSGVDPNAAAQSVEAILGDPRGWTRDPAYGFQLVGAGQPVDFTVKIATPTTTDRLCEVVTPELVGETNCRAGHTVVVNLKRWQEGSPQFKGPVEEYRALIVNHEVGHEIGRDHETCPGPGKPAPAMMQQIKGLLGCQANAWPFDGKGTYLSGPNVP
ncbi:membrane protein [Streptomyces sp. NRRL S-444]|nr:membrane protein [Streptomyces sp. NRRL S-444]